MEFRYRVDHVPDDFKKKMTGTVPVARWGSVCGNLRALMLSGDETLFSINNLLLVQVRTSIDVPPDRAPWIGGSDDAINRFQITEEHKVDRTELITMGLASMKRMTQWALEAGLKNSQFRDVRVEKYVKQIIDAAVKLRDCAVGWQYEHLVRATVNLWAEESVLTGDVLASVNQDDYLLRHVLGIKTDEDHWPGRLI
jgi:hypothetical protein